VSLFNFIWTASEVDDEIYSGLLHALQRISNDILKIGKIEQVLLSDGILIFKKLENITVGLLSSKCSKFLMECVERFSFEFENSYDTKLVNRIYNMGQFNSAIKLVEKYFANVPSKIEDQIK
jgi:hypothetical protein